MLGYIMYKFHIFLIHVRATSFAQRAGSDFYHDLFFWGGEGGKHITKKPS